jgi:hypothetical protein
MAAGRSVVVLPGRNFGAYVPQLFFPMMAAVRRDAEPVAVSWRDVEAVSEMGADELPGWVSDQVRCDLSGLEPESTLVVGKSLGSYAAGLVAELGFPAIWVTPVLISDEIVAALRRAHSPFLLAGGTADDLWISDVARELTPHVLEIDGADHGLFVQGPLDQSAHNIGLLAAACESFIDAYVWTSGEHADEPA